MGDFVVGLLLGAGLTGMALVFTGWRLLIWLGVPVDVLVFRLILLLLGSSALVAGTGLVGVWSPRGS